MTDKSICFLNINRIILLHSPPMNFLTQLVGYLWRNSLNFATNWALLFFLKVKVPSKKTTYWCEVFKVDNIVKVGSKKHIIEVNIGLLESFHISLKNHCLLRVRALYYHPVILKNQIWPNLKSSIHSAIIKLITKGLL